MNDPPSGLPAGPPAGLPGAGGEPVAASLSPSGPPSGSPSGSPSAPPSAVPSQVTLRTVFTVCAGVLATVALVYFVTLTRVAITLSFLAAMIAVALHHAVRLLGRVGLRRWTALLVVGVAFVGIVTVLGFVLVPPAVRQAQVLGDSLPQLVEHMRHTAAFAAIDQHVNISAMLERLGQEAPGLVFKALNALVGLLAAGVTVLFLSIFMLIFGPSLIARTLGEATARRGAQLQRVLDKIYRAIGGYIAGITLICWINTLCTGTFLAILRMPFFLPVAIVSGASSLLPYVGSLITSVVITGLALATLGTWQAVACAIWFVAYGQIEGNILGPLVFRRTAHVNPLITTLALLFLGEAAGIIGAVVAIPVVAALQIIVREVLRARREAQLAPAGTGPTGSAPG
jgi:putative heme transporter